MCDHNQFEVIPTKDHICVRFRKERTVLSSAVLNGGLLSAANIVIMKVKKNLGEPEQNFENPAETLSKYSESILLKGTTVGMMTAASMDSFRQTTRSFQGVDFTAIVTAGISNARCAGDSADWQKLQFTVPATGTINIILIANAPLSRAAMVEAVMVATEAKTLALRELGVKSPVSGTIATGTGTDAIAVASGIGPAEISYCGKHVPCGEMLASAVIEALINALKNEI
ncbi:MAG: adenosylcobinamide amidohydrolase [Desulfobacterales bacterium]|nr:MAG: adenosylcobinamide amidohydrolase [Desulfobacterales bacterium]